MTPELPELDSPWIATFEGWRHPNSTGQLAHGPFVIEVYQETGKHSSVRWKAWLKPINGPVCEGCKSAVDAMNIVNAMFVKRTVDWKQV